jgi:hypothetical protein
LDTHFRDHDTERRLGLGKFIYTKYKEAGKRASEITETFVQLQLGNEVRNRTYEMYLQEETILLTSLKTEPPLEQARFNYITALDRYSAASACWENEATKAGINPGMTVLPTRPLPKSLTDALKAKNVAAVDIGLLEGILGLDHRWEPTSAEYLETKKLLVERKYRLALDRLERLIIQRLFELQKVNLVSTGEFFLFLDVL